MILYLFSKLARSEESRRPRKLQVKLSCLKAFKLRLTIHTPFDVERQAGKLHISIFKSFGLTRHGIERESTVTAADAQFTFIVDLFAVTSRYCKAVSICSGSPGPFLASWQRQKYGGATSKMTTWEAGHREPTVVVWPGHIEANQVSDALTSALDVFPTLLSLAGIDFPPNRHYDGMDLSRFFMGKMKSAHSVSNLIQCRNIVQRKLLQVRDTCFLPQILNFLTL